MYSSEDEYPTVYEGEGGSPKKEWISFLNSIKAEELLHRQEDLQGLWLHLREEEPELLTTFEFFLDNAVKEIDDSKDDKDLALVCKERSERKIQQIFYEVESILEEERARIKSEYEEKYQIELNKQINVKQNELDHVIERKRDLERQLEDLNLNDQRRSESLRNLNTMVRELSAKEMELLNENESLQQENRLLQVQLSTSIDNLKKSQEFCVNLHEKAEREKHDIAREYQDAIAKNHENTRETEKLEIQLEQMKSEQSKLSEEPRRDFPPYSHRMRTLDVVCECDQINYESVVPKTPDRVFKIILVGDSNVGKTSVMHRLCHDSFNEERSPTLDISYLMKTMVTVQGVTSLQIWDTVGQERFRSVPKSYFRKADGVMLLYDVTNDDSIKSVRHWLANIEECSCKNAVIMLLGNKIDHEGRKVSWEDGMRMAHDCKTLFAEVCAKTGENIPQAFETITRILQQQEDGDLLSGTPLGETVVLEDMSRDAKKTTSCCGMNFTNR